MRIVVCAYSFRLFVAPVRCACSLRLFIAPIHCADRSRLSVSPKTKPHRITCGVLRNKSLTMTYFHRRPSTIIGAKAFHCPVRDGKEWYHLAMVVRRNWLSCCVVRNRSNLGRNTTCGDQRTSSMITHKGYVIGVGWLLTVQPDFVLNDTWNAISPGHNHQCYRIKPHEQLVSVSLTHYCASTPDLSTSWSRTTL